jgi:tetratricopeptide (TPR) repeat protein
VAALQQAVSLDPGYASAYALLAMSRNMLAELGTDSISADAEQAIAAAERAVSLAPELPDAYSARGYVRFLRQWDWSGARADFESAVRLGPRDSASHRRYALLMAALGQFSEAVAAARLGTEIEPLYVNSWLILGICLSGAGQHLAAHKALSDALEISPESSRVRAHLTRAELLLGRPQDALAINAQQQISKWRLSNDAMAEHALGNATVSEIALVSLIDRHGEDAPSLIADVYAWRHDLDRSAEWLERAYRQRDRSLSLIKCDPCLNGLHNSARYRALLRNMNLPA